MNSLDTRFSRNVFEAVQKTRSTCLSTDARVLNITKSLVKKVLKLEFIPTVQRQFVIRVDTSHWKEVKAKNKFIDLLYPPAGAFRISSVFGPARCIIALDSLHKKSFTLLIQFLHF